MLINHAPTLNTSTISLTEKTPPPPFSRYIEFSTVRSLARLGSWHPALESKNSPALLTSTPLASSSIVDVGEVCGFWWSNGGRVRCTCTWGRAGTERSGPWTGHSEKTSLEVTFVCYSRGLCLLTVSGGGQRKRNTGRTTLHCPRRSHTQLQLRPLSVSLSLSRSASRFPFSTYALSFFSFFFRGCDLTKELLSLSRSLKINCLLGVLRELIPLVNAGDLIWHTNPNSNPLVLRV